MTTLVNPPSLVWSIWRHSPGADYVISCCLSKSLTEYAQIVAANSMKTAVHICTMPFSLYIWLSIFYPSDPGKRGLWQTCRSSASVCCVQLDHLFPGFFFLVFFSTFSPVSPLSLIPKPQLWKWSQHEAPNKRFLRSFIVHKILRSSRRGVRKRLRLARRQKSCKKNEAKEKKKGGR